MITILRYAERIEHATPRFGNPDRVGINGFGITQIDGAVAGGLDGGGNLLLIDMTAG